MKLTRILTVIFFATAVLWQVQCLAQQQMDLATIKFTEEVEQLVKAVPDLHEGKLGGRQHMVSYGFDNDGRFTFARVTPGHLELISWRAKLVGYAFKIRSFADQQKVEQFFRTTYKDADWQTSKFMNIARYNGGGIVAALRIVPEAKYKDGANGYLTIKTAEFSKVFEEMIKR